MTSKDKVVEPEQLQLGVKVSFLSNLRNRYAKYFRNISLSSSYNMFQSLLFWINWGIVGSIFFLIYRYEELLQVGKGVVFPISYESPIFLAKLFSIRDLSLLQYANIIALLVNILFILVTLAVSRRGNTKIIPFILALDTILLLLIGKAILTPIILLQ